MIPPEIRMELDKLLRRIETLERTNREVLSRTEVERIADKAVDSLRPELNALKRRAG